MTQITVGVSDFVTGKWYILIPLIVGGAYGFMRWKKTERGRAQWDRVKLRFPRIGDVVRKVALARWSRTFSGTISSGVPILQAIEISGADGRQRGDPGGDGRRLRLGQARRHDRPARSSEHEVFPPMVAHMVPVGEESGQLETMLAKIADFYEAEVDAKIKSLTVADRAADDHASSAASSASS